MEDCQVCGGSGQVITTMVVQEHCTITGTWSICSRAFGIACGCVRVAELWHYLGEDV